MLFFFFVMSVRMKTGCKELDTWVKSQVPTRQVKYFTSGTTELSIPIYCPSSLKEPNEFSDWCIFMKLLTLGGKCNF